MTVYSIFGLSIAMFMLAITPGPGVLAVTSKALTAGCKGAIPVIIGVILGDLFFLLLAIYGLTAIATMFDVLLLTVKYVGALYLVWLGIKLWCTDPGYYPAEVARTDKYNFLLGLSITLGNPKVILFYLAFLPTFIDISTLSVLDVLLLVFVVSVILCSVLLIYAWSASRACKLIQSSVANNILNKIAGGVLIGAGSALMARS